MRNAETATGSVAVCTTRAWFERFCQYDHDRFSTRRASPSRLRETRERVSFPRGHAFRVLHEPPVQIVCSNRIGIGISCIYSETLGPETRELSRLPLWRPRLSPFRPEGVSGHRTRESADSQEARTGVRQDPVGRLGLRARASATPLSGNGGGEGRVL